MPLKIEGDVVVRLTGAAGGSYAASLAVIRDIGVIGDRKCSISARRPADPATHYPGIKALRSCLNSRIQGGIVRKSQVKLAAPHAAELVIGCEIELVRRGTCQNPASTRNAVTVRETHPPIPCSVRQ